MADTVEKMEIDESLYSRQLYVLGHDASAKMAKSDVLISGLGGLGVEIAKNTILSGVKSVTLHDTKNATNHDLAAQFFLTEDDLDTNRAVASESKCSELNPYVKVNAATQTLTEDFIKQFNVVVLTDSVHEEQLRLSKVCHDNGIPVIIASTRGLFGQIFCDFGEDFTVVDVNGREPITLDVANVTKEVESVVSLPDKMRHGLQDGDYVQFTEIQGMTELNRQEPFPVTVLSPMTFSIGDTSQYSDYTNGGICKQIKMSKKMSFKSLQESLLNPSLNAVDIRKEHEVHVIHMAFLALHQYEKQNGRLPRPWNDDDVSDFLSVFREVNEQRANKIGNIDETILRLFSYTASGDCVPVNAVIGSIVAQEVSKACSGKFSPIFQWLYFDAVECLPEDRSILTEENCMGNGNRYDAQAAIFGQQLQSQLANLKYFLVGAGAIGCELLKNFAMLGVGSGPEGKIIVTDMDIIEKSNLNRQFLFRPWNVKQPKSETAANAVRKMNSSVKIEAHQIRVGPESEHIYNSAFYESLDGVANALDNVEARRYMDTCCWHHRKPLLESGTLGTSGSTQVIVPHLTERFTLLQAPSAKKAVPMCTVRNFPSKIEHTLEWSRDLFEGEFHHKPEFAKQYLLGSERILETLKSPSYTDIDTLKSLSKVLVKDRPYKFEDCVAWARQHWEDQYHHQILDLLSDFPEDLVTDNGAKFWSGSKRCPHALTFDVNSSLHLDYIVAAANLMAEVYGITQVRDRSVIAEIVATVQVTEYVPRETPESAVDVISYQLGSVSMDDLQKSIPPLDSLKDVIISPLDFEKDDDTNFHIDFIVAASNLRAENYGIETADRQRSKKIAGNIIPAIVTSTALVAGLVSLELLKVIQGHQDLELYRNNEFNLALPRFCLAEPEPASTKMYKGKKWTIWDRFEVEGDMTLQDFIQYFHNEHKLDVTMVSHGNRTIHSELIPEEERTKRMKQKISDILKDVLASEGLEPQVSPILMLDISADDEDEEDVDVPHVRYTIPVQSA